MKIAIIGSRTFNDYRLLEKLILEKVDLTCIEEVISGGAVICFLGWKIKRNRK
jgi:hypothetical protein